MPYLVGEHNCGLYHYGDQSVIRPCCVEYCKQRAEIALRVAMTDQHPAYRAYVAAWNSLTYSEMALVPDVRYMGIDRGLVALTEEQRARYREAVLRGE